MAAPGKNTCVKFYMRLRELVPERFKGVDCKSIGFADAGSNPAQLTKIPGPPVEDPFANFEVPRKPYSFRGTEENLEFLSAGSYRYKYQVGAPIVFSPAKTLLSAEKTGV